MAKKEHPEHKQKRAVWIAVVVCIVSALALVAYVFFVIPNAKQSLFSQYPELKQVTNVVESKYPKASIGAYVNYVTTGEKTTSQMTVTYSGPELGEKEIKDIGALACGELKQVNKKYDKVVVLIHKPLLPFPIPGLQLGENTAYPGSCK